MSAGIELYNNVLNQLGSPALYSDIFANRPAFGYTGRLFISTDTLEIYRDTGTAWQLLSSGGGGTNIYNSNGTLTANRTLTNGGFSLTFTGAASSFVFNLDANTNVSRQLNFTTGSVKRWSTEITDNETGANAGSNYYLRSFQDGGTSLLDVLTITRSTGVVSHNSNAVLSTAIDNLTGIYNVNRGTYTAAAYTGGNPQNAIYNIFTHDARINQTYGNGQYIAAAANVWRFEPTDSYTLTLTQATGVRTMGAALYTTQYNIPAGKTETVSHLSGITLLGIYDLFTGGRGTLAVTNAYGLVINDLNEYAYGTLTLTNRWGIYQGGASDSNYFNGNTLIGSTTSTGEKLQVTGTARVTQSAYFATASGNVGIGTTSPYTLANYTTLTLNNAVNGGLLAFQVNGNTNAYIYSISSQAVIATLTNISLIFSTNTVERMRITGGGNVGIGNANPGRTLVVDGQTGGGVFQLTNNTAGNAAGNGMELISAGLDGFLNVRNNGYLSVATNNTERMRITNGGNVLIGTTSDPGDALNVAGTFRTSNYWILSGSPGGAGSSARYISGGGTSNTWYHNIPSGGSYVFAVAESTTAFFINASNNVGLTQTTFGTSATRTLAISSGTAPGSSPADCFQLYSADITAGNAAAHFRTENGAIVKIYQETTGVGSATYAAGGGAGSIIKTDDTIGGYTMLQVVKALQNLGILA